MNLSELKKIWRENGFWPNKRLGQNFLIDNNVRDKIIRNLDLGENDTVIEIGPGFGVMTFELAKVSKRVIAVEKDRKICQIMEGYFSEAGNIELVNDDILKVDLSECVTKGKVIVFGNIPYYISTHIIEKIIENRNYVSKGFLVMQEELVDRYVSCPGSKRYGSVSCFVQYYTLAKKLLNIKKNSFYPRPQVQSSLLSLSLLDEPQVQVLDETGMFKVIRQAFAQRRKKAVNSLSCGEFNKTREDWIDLFKNLNLDPDSRAEVLSLEDYARISDAL